MDIPKVIIEDNYNDFLNGKEVEGTVFSSNLPVQKGMRVMGFHNSIAAKTGISVPRDKQSHYIGVEGEVTDIHSPVPSDGHHAKIRLIKV